MLFYYVLCHLCPLKLNSLKLISLSTLVSPQIKNVLKLSHNSNSIYRQQKSPLPFSPSLQSFFLVFSSIFPHSSDQYHHRKRHRSSNQISPPFARSNLTTTPTPMSKISWRTTIRSPQNEPLFILVILQSQLII